MFNGGYMARLPIRSVMNKVALQFFITLGVLGLTWFCISRIDFVKIYALEDTKKVNEAKLGNLMYEQFTSYRKEIDGDSVKLILNKIKTRLAKPNKLNADSIKIHLVEADEVNAFALPGDHIVIHSALINFCDTPEQLTGVLAHEIAHLKKSHVMKKLTKEVGLSVLISVAGGKGSGILKKITEKISSSAYDRQLESEADETAVSYMTKSKIDPEQFADLLIKFSSDLENKSFNTEWISSHPESKDRAAHVLELNKTKVIASPILSDHEWEILQSASRSEDSED